MSYAWWFLKLVASPSGRVYASVVPALWGGRAAEGGNSIAWLAAILCTVVFFLCLNSHATNGQVLRVYSFASRSGIDAWSVLCWKICNGKIFGFSRAGSYTARAVNGRRCSLICLFWGHFLPGKHKTVWYRRCFFKICCYCFSCEIFFVFRRARPIVGFFLFVCFLFSFSFYPLFFWSAKNVLLGNILASPSWQWKKFQPRPSSFGQAKTSFRLTILFAPSLQK